MISSAFRHCGEQWAWKWFGSGHNIGNDMPTVIIVFDNEEQTKMEFLVDSADVLNDILEFQYAVLPECLNRDNLIRVFK